MKVCIITQDDPFYLYEMFSNLRLALKGKHELVAVICQSNSPFGENLRLYQKAWRVLTTFGFIFFFRFAVRFFVRKYITGKTVENFCLQNNIKLVRIEGSINTSSSVNLIKALGGEIGVSIAGKEIFKQCLIDTFPNGILNLHTSSLPAYRGLMPVFWALCNSEHKIGISVFLVDKGIDTGLIVAQSELEVGERRLDVTIRRTKELAVRTIIQALNLVERRERIFIPGNRKGSYFSFPTRQDVKIFIKNGNKFF